MDAKGLGSANVTLIELGFAICKKVYSYLIHWLDHFLQANQNEGFLTQLLTGFYFFEDVCESYSETKLGVLKSG